MNSKKCKKFERSIRIMEENLEKLEKEKNYTHADNSDLSTFIKLPKYIQKKKAVVNIQSDDIYSFLWSVTASLHPAERHVCRTSSYPHFNDILKYDEIEFPINLEDVSTFEYKNSLSVNVYGIEHTKNAGQDKIVPIRLSQNLGPVINLLMLKNSNMICHFTCIRNLPRLVSSQNGKRHRSSWLCNRCLCFFKSEYSLKKHKIKDHRSL